MEDTGPQKAAGRLNIEGAVGRPSVDRASPGAAVAPVLDADKDTEMKDGGEKMEGDEQEDKAE
jgi:hypothetical protein